MKLSRKTDYGVMLMEILKPSFKSGRFVSLADIAKKHSLPLAFLEKLADMLRKRELLESRRGQSGGYRLVRDPKSITLRELIDIFEEPPMMRCMKSSDPKKHCPYAAACPTRKTWNGVQKEMYAIFEKITVDAL